MGRVSAGRLADSLSARLSELEPRRSTLLPRVGGWGAANDAPPFTPLEDMANPPSPISHPRPLFNGEAAPPPPPLRLSIDDEGGPRSLDGRSPHRQHTPTCHPNLSHRRYQHQQSLQHSLNYTYGSIEDEGGVASPDPGELQQEVLELSHTNKRLTGENQELTSHLTVAEETNANLREQCVTLRHAVEGLHQQLEAARALEVEVELARRQVEEGKDEREQLLNRLAYLERDNSSLTTRLHNLSEQFSSAQEELEGQTQKEEEAVKRHRDEVARLSSQLAHWKAQAETQTLASYHLQETLEDVKKLVEVLREEKRSLEEQLSHVKGELAAATHTESDLSGTDGAEGVLGALDSPSAEKSSDGSGREGSGVGLPPTSPSTPAAFTTTNAAAAQITPAASISQPSSVNTPLSIHSEIQTMGEDSGSLPFCEKTEGSGREERQSGSSSEAGDTPLASVLASMLRWWRDWEESGIPLLRAMLDKDTVALHNHVATHYEELVRLERELQQIRRMTQSSPATPRYLSLEEALKEGSVGSTQDSALPSSQATTPTLPKRRPRTPGSHVSHLISMFESSSQSSSPVYSEASEQPGSVDHPGRLSRMLQRASWKRRRSSDDFVRSESTNSDDERSSDPNLRNSLENMRYDDNQTVHSKDVCDGREVGASHNSVFDGAIGSDGGDRVGDCIYLEYGLEQEDEEVEKQAKAKIQIHSSTTVQGQEEKQEQKEDEVVNFSKTMVEDDALEPESDPYMETSHLMKLMNEVADQRMVITELRQQVVSAEDAKERHTATIQRLHRYFLQVSSDVFRWTEGVRREWLAVVVPRVGGGGEEGEGGESLTPATPTHPLDEVPLTTSFSREEIEALISARRDPPACDARPREEDRPGHVSSPENLAAELERELTALRVHVLRSHALLHHYQSSSSGSQYGSRAEVSTPAPPPPPHVQGVEVGVECDLCGPTCVPRPCDSTATQTPASPLSTTPECEEAPSSALLASSSARREEEKVEERREGKEEEKDKTLGRRHRTHPQQRVKWKEDLENQAEEEEEEVVVKEEVEEVDINEGTTTHEGQALLLSVGGGAKDLPHSPQRPSQQQEQAPQQTQRPPAPRQVGVTDLPEHRQLRQVEVVPPAHRTLRQLGVGQEEEDLQDSAFGVEEGVEIIPMTSEHSLYSPKPAYDHLDHYRSGGQARGRGQEKLRRTGLSTITPLVSSSERRGEATHSPILSRPRTQMELTPLSPPPSLDNVEEEDMEEEEEEEEEPALPSTPESSSSFASGDMFPQPPQPSRGPPRLPRQLSMSASDPPAAASSSSSLKKPHLHTLLEADPPSANPPQEEQETQQEASTTEEDEKRKKVFPSLHDTVLRMAGLARTDPVFTSNTSILTSQVDPGSLHTPHSHKQVGTPLPALEGVRVGEEVGGGRLVRPDERGEAEESGKEAPQAAGTLPTTPSPVKAARGPRSPESDNLPEKAPSGDTRSPGSASRHTPEAGKLRTRRSHLPGTKTSTLKLPVNETIPEEPHEEINSSPEKVKRASQTEKPLVRKSSLPELKTLLESPGKGSLPEETDRSPGFLSQAKPRTDESPVGKTSLPETKAPLTESPEKRNIPEETSSLPSTPHLEPLTEEPPVRKTSLPETKTASPDKAGRSPERAKPRVTFSPDTKPPEDLPGGTPIKIRTFSELTDALGIITSPLGRTRASTSSSDSSWGSTLDMDVELPIPEQLSCLYDVVKAVKNSNENLSQQEIETKFTQLSLAFKTDRLTLRQRLDLQQRHRDTAENNHEADMDCLRRLVLEIQVECADPELSDAISQVRRHLDVLTASSTRLVSTSEVWGAVQQEWRLARAVEVIFRHVEDVKKKYETVKQELEELRRLLTEYQIELPVSNVTGSSGGSGSNSQVASDSPSISRRVRALSLAVQAGSDKESRRVSGPSSKTSSSGFAGAYKSRGRRASLMPDLKPFREQRFAASAAAASFAAVAAASASKDSSSSSSSSSGSGPSAYKDHGEEGTGSGVTPPSASRRLNCSITEEVSESGEDEGGSSTQDTTTTTTTTTDTTTTTTTTTSTSTYRESSTLPALSPALLSHLQSLAAANHGNFEDTDERSDDESQSDASEESSVDCREPPRGSFTASLWNRFDSQHWLVETLQEVLEWAKGGQWPYSQQQTVLGARYAFTSLLLLVAALFLLVTLSSGDVNTPQPCHPGWTTMHHILHPFVTLRYLEQPPT